MADQSKKGRREPNFTEEEKMCLLAFVRQHKTRLLGKAGRPGHGDDKVEERKAKYWQLCAESIAAAGGKQRDWKKVRKQWFELKDRAKKFRNQTRATGGGPAPSSTPSIELALEVVAREALDGIRGRGSEPDPLAQPNSCTEMSQSSSQDSVEATLVLLPADAAAAKPSTSSASPAPTTEPTCSLVALQQQMTMLASQVEMLTQQPAPTTLQRTTELRQLQYQEELLKLERRKVDLQCQALEVQKNILAAVEALGVTGMLSSMTEQ